ncbi:Pyridine nucleotide-disulfide oxidoreductase, partial [human gut metagenome]
KMGIDYDPAAKYLGRHGKFIGKPAPSAVNCGVQDMIYNIKAQWKREVIIVGGGVAGIQTALRLADRGIRPTIVEKEPDLGGKLRGWYHLFPSLTPASEVLSELRRRLAARDVEVMTSAEAVSITPGSVTLADGRTLESRLGGRLLRLHAFRCPAQGGIRLRGL